MRSRIALLALLAVGLGLVGWALFARETDEEAIRRRLDAIGAGVAIVPEEGVVARALRVKGALEESIAKDAHVAVPELRDRLDRDALIGAAVQAGQRWSAGRLSFGDVRVQPRGDGLARVDATAELDGTVSGEPRSDERRVSLEMAKRDGEWIVTSLEVEPPSAEDDEGGW